MTVIENKNQNTGLGFIGALQIAFIVLKLCNIITWKWWVVLLPCIVSVSLIVLLLLYCLWLIIKYR